tara:strand:+ start:35 stop:298 length:264 start_codon:yes stop_codon:yes gene_type:complete
VDQHTATDTTQGIVDTLHVVVIVEEIQQVIVHAVAIVHAAVVGILVVVVRVDQVVVAVVIKNKDSRERPDYEGLGLTLYVGPPKSSK